MIRPWLALLGEAVAGPRVLVAITVAFAAGVLAGAYSLGPVPVGFCCLLGGASGCIARRFPAALLLLMLPVLGWTYCLWRTPRPAVNDVSAWSSSKKIIFGGEVLEVWPSATGTSERCVVATKRLLFPGRSPLCGRTLLMLSGTSGATAGRDPDFAPEPAAGAGHAPPGSANHDCGAGGSENKRPRAPAPPVLEPGDAIEVRARVAAPTRTLYPWQFDEAQYLRRRGIFSIAFARQADLLSVRTEARKDESSWPAMLGKRVSRWLEDTRLRMVAMHRRCAGSPEGELLASMVLGDRAVKLPEALSDRFRDLGLSHILAASGFNLTLVTGVTLWLCRLVTRSVRVSNLTCFVSMLVFVGLAGPSPSVMRAALMCSFVLASRCASRTLYAPSALSLALMITLIADPASIADAGLQLSYAATAGLVCAACPLTAWLGGASRVPLPNWLAETVAVVLVAQACVLPIQLNCFWQVGLLFLPANLLATPIVSLVTAAGFFSSMLVLLDPSGLLVGVPVAAIDGAAAYPLRLMVWLVDALASCEAAKLHLGPPVAPAVAFYYLCLIAFIFCLRARRSVVIGLAAYLAAVAAVVWRPAPPRLTLASFPRALILLTDRGEALCLGDAARGDPARFLAYSGVKNTGAVAAAFAVRRCGALAAIEARGEARRILLIDCRDNLAVPAGGVPPASVVVVREPPRRGRARPADARALAEIIRRSSARWVVVHRPEALAPLAGIEPGRRACRLGMLLGKLPAAQIIYSGRNPCILMADDRDGRGLSFARAGAGAGN